MSEWRPRNPDRRGEVVFVGSQQTADRIAGLGSFDHVHIILRDQRADLAESAVLDNDRSGLDIEYGGQSVAGRPEGMQFVTHSDTHGELGGGLVLIGHKEIVGRAIEGRVDRGPAAARGGWNPKQKSSAREARKGFRKHDTYKQ